ncbi:hypothetical protein RUM43_002000, partial [Polyplax serrata]
KIVKLMDVKCKSRGDEAERQNIRPMKKTRKTKTKKEDSFAGEAPMSARSRAIVDFDFVQIKVE